MRTMVVGWTIGFAALGAGCASHASQAETDLETQQALFAKTAPAAYHLFWTCQSCDVVARTIDIAVSGSAIDSAVYMDDGQPVSDEVRGGLRTADGVFDLIADRLHDSYHVDVGYDPALHYPRYLYISLYKTGHAEGDLSLSLSLEPQPLPEPPDTGKAALQAEVARQRALFVEPESYSFTVQTTCYCEPGSDRPIRVSVTDSAVTRVVYEGSTLPVPDDVRLASPTMPGWFDIITRRVADDSGLHSNEMAFAYDPKLHYPTLLKTISTIPDGNADVSLTDFVAPADAP